MSQIGRELLEKILYHLTRLREGSGAGSEERHLELIEEAKKEWQMARAYFNDVTDPELIDHAIYSLEAAEKRYVYLLRKAREEKLFQEKMLS